MNEKIRLKLDTLPQSPGSYQYFDKDHNVIYVGKAKNLYNRVRSYFVGAHNAKTTKLVSMIDDLEYIITSTEEEAFVLEINLIKKYHPKYNISLMDDKRYPYIVLTNEESPRLIYTRDIEKNHGKVFGPYPNAKDAKMVCDLLNRVYPFRKCRHIGKKECLYYHMHQCLAPCINKVDKATYSSLKAKIVSILKGNVKEEIKNLNILMEEASLSLRFEDAIEYRNLINSLEVVAQRQKMEGYLDDIDVIGYYKGEEYLSIQVFHLRDSKMIERNGYLLDIDDDVDEQFSDFIYHFYLVLNNPVPKKIYIPCGNSEDISKKLGTNVIIPKKGKNVDLVNLVIENAKERIDNLIMKRQLQFRRTNGASIELSKLLGFDIHSIEAFDNSNIMGASAVSALVRYDDGKKNPKMYRKYKVKTVEGANDVATMYEVVQRRYKDRANLPDLIIMDGGENQVNSCLKCLKDINVNIKVLGLVKDANHNTRALWYNNQEIEIDKHSDCFMMLSSIQEEVHRFAITYFRSLHSKNSFVSQLDNIKGIGKVKKQKILNIINVQDFEKELDKLSLNEEQKQKVLEIFKK